MKNSRGWLITHKNCLDGATAAAVAKQCGLASIFVEPDRVVEDGLSKITDHQAVYLADVSLKPEQYAEFGNRIEWLLDHHQSANPLKAFPHVTIDMSISGAHLFYNFALARGWMKPTEAWDRLIRAVERYDLWQPMHGEGQNLNRLFHHEGYAWYASRFSRGWSPYTKAEQDHLAALIAEERQFVRQHLAQAIRVSDPLPLAAVTLNTEGSVNEVAHQLLQSGSSLVIFLKQDGRLSVRSDTRINAAALMEAIFHGGGHARAAGGRIDHQGPYQPSEVHDVLRQITDYLGSH